MSNLLCPVLGKQHYFLPWGLIIVGCDACLPLALIKPQQSFSVVVFGKPFGLLDSFEDGNVSGVISEM